MQIVLAFVKRIGSAGREGQQADIIRKTQGGTGNDA
jgi:hypothetical protein